MDSDISTTSKTPKRTNKIKGKVDQVVKTELADDFWEVFEKSMKKLNNILLGIEEKDDRHIIE